MRTAAKGRNPLVEASINYSTGRQLRSCEWALIAFFLYIASISAAFHLRSQLRSVPFVIAALVIALIVTVARAEESTCWTRIFSFSRDWLTLILVIVAYREMNWFTPRIADHHLDNLWIQWDRWLLDDFGLRRMIESTGILLPILLELSYLVVYAVGPFTVALLYKHGRRDLVGRVLFVYVVGTVAAYGLFPYFPSSPPRAAFAGMDMPSFMTLMRTLNLAMVGGFGIHSSVFPSAHVSSAFSAAWALLIYMPERRRVGLCMLVYAILVSFATIYGRYHYAVDALAGLGISIGAAALAYTIQGRRTAPIT